MLAQFIQINVIEEIVEFSHVYKEYINCFIGDDPVMSRWHFWSSIFRVLDVVEMLKQFIVAEDFTWSKISDFIYASFLMCDDFPFLNIAERMNIFIFYFNYSLQWRGSSFYHEEAIWFASLVIYNFSFIVSLFLQHIIEFQNTIVGKFV